MTTPRPSNGLRGRVVAFRADASVQIGSGHVMRCLTLADGLREQGADSVFLCREHEGHLCELIETRGFQVHRLPALNPLPETEVGTPAHASWLGASWERDVEACLPILADLSPAWLVVDHYALDRHWETAVRTALASPPRLLVIDDLADRPHAADLLLDQNLGRHEADYQGLVPEGCQVLIGPRYALLRPEFAEWRDASLTRRAGPAKLKRLLISLGGVDKDNVTGRILENLRDCELPPDLEITVVMGGAAPGLADVSAKARSFPRPVRVVVNVNDMAQRMAEADLAIGAAGSTAWERCCLGLPCIMIVLADNQESIASALDHVGAAVNLGHQEQLSRLPALLAELSDKSSLSSVSERAAGVADGLGVDRVVNEIKRVVL